MKFSLFLFLCSIFFTQAQAAECLNARVAEDLIKDFSWVSDSSVSDCQNSLAQKTLAALLTIKMLPALSQKTDEFNRNNLKELPYAYFKNRIRVIVLEQDGSKRCGFVKNSVVSGGVSAFQTRDEMHVCPRVLNSSTFRLSSIFVHEARHVDGFSHVQCEHGVLATFDQSRNGGGSCDTSFEQGGSYGVQVEYEAAISRSSGVNSAVRQEARGLALTDMMMRFNQLPLGLTYGAVLHSDSGKILFYDGNNLQPLPGLETSETGILTMQYGSPTLYDPATGTISTQDSSSQVVADTTGVAARKFRELGPEQREGLLDVFYHQEYSCFLFPTHLQCMNGSNRADIRLRAIKPLRFLFTERSVLVQENILFIAAENGYLYALPASWDELVTASESDLKRSADAYKVLNIGPWAANDEIVLNQYGAILHYATEEKKWSLIPALRAKYKKVFAPYLWSKKLRDL